MSINFVISDQQKNVIKKHFREYSLKQNVENIFLLFFILNDFYKFFDSFHDFVANFEF